MHSRLALCLIGSSALLLAGDNLARARPKRSGNVRTASAPKAITKFEGTLEASLHFGRIDLDDGLPAPGVYAIAQDTLGFMWFGTQGGLARWDGRTMQVHQHRIDDPGSLSSSSVQALAVDHMGALWVGTTDSGLNRLDPKTQAFTRYRNEEQNKKSLSSDAISALLVDADDTLWVGGDAGLNKLNPDGTFSLAHGLETVKVTALAQNKAQHIFVGTAGDGLLEYDPKADRVLAEYRADDNPKHLIMDNIRVLRFDHKGALWIGTEGKGVCVLDVEKGEFRRTPVQADITIGLVEDTLGKIWFNSRQHLVELDPESGHVRFHKPDHTRRDHFSQASTMSSYVNRDGVVFFGTEGNGLSYFDPLAVQLGLQRLGTAATCFTEDDEGMLWLGTTPGEATSGVYKIDRKTGHFVRYTRVEIPEAEGGALDLSTYWITSCARDPNGTLWFGSNRFGALNLDPKTDSFHYYPIGASNQNNGVFAILPTANRIWLATWGQGLMSLDVRKDKVDTFVKEPGNPDSISSDNLYTVVQDKRDPKFLWLGTAGGGVSRFSTADGSATRYVHEEGNPASLSDDNVASIYQSDDGILWLGSYGGGLNALDLATGKVTRYGKEAGIHAETIYGIFPDHKGRLWMATNGDGLITFEPKTGRVHAFLQRDGVQNNDFAQGSAYRSRRGTLIFGGFGGYNEFDPDAIQPDDKGPAAAITDVELPNRPLIDTGPKYRGLGLDRPPWMGPDAVLGYKDLVVSFEFVALSFSDPSRNRFLYRLRGLHSDWLSTNQGKATYTSLPDGKYVFEVRTVGRHGAEGPAVASLPLIVRPAPWRTWWAYTIYGLIGLGFVLLYLRYQRQRVRALEQAHRLASVERDLEITAALQTGCLPPPGLIKHEDELLLTGVYSPAEQCSGDWWWYEKDAGDVHWILVGDVTGHGPGPAMVTAAVAAAFRVQAGDGTRSALQRIESLNREVLKIANGRYQMTLSAVEIHAKSGRFFFYSAGGLPVVALHRNKAKAYVARGTPLGTPNLEVGTLEGQLGPQERLMIMTDGLPEIELDKAGGKMLGIHRLVRIFESTGPLPIQDAGARILATAKEAQGPRPQSDDWTFVLADWRPARAAGN